MFVVSSRRPLTNRPLQLLCTIAPLKAFFLWKKKGYRKHENKNNNKKNRTAIYTRTHTNTYNYSFKPTQTDMIEGPFSSCLSTLPWLLAFLSLGLIRLLVEIKVIGEDSWANDESVCAVIGLIKRMVL
ncbi:hypothetical protein AMECASPLE_014869 [Ameca splendens]|uniref:Uncharacterized protein n=1 Tax=Ameca splendens TaxID=208324 RepID=A0ABV0YZW8_9TELE